MTKQLAAYWACLKDTVHPDDVLSFSQDDNHNFNLEFPPPAFIGDILNAPVIILENNGGYDPRMTPYEFPDARACDEFREMLSVPRPVDPTARSMSPYYLQRNYSKWLISGEAALVNGVAYRSVNGNAKGVKRLTNSLPSARFHQNWLRQILFPLAERSERFVVLHRWSRWSDAPKILMGLPTVIRSTAPVSPDLTVHELSAVRSFLG